MRCDNYCPRCGEPVENVTHAIFECPPALQAWALSSTPSSSQIFPISSMYANMDYLFRRKNTIRRPEYDRDPYPQIIWYIWKARNDKLFKGIDRAPLELVRYNAKDSIPTPPQAPIVEETQALSLDNICMVDSSWTSTTTKQLYCENNILLQYAHILLQI